MAAKKKKREVTIDLDKAEKTARRVAGRAVGLATPMAKVLKSSERANMAAKRTLKGALSGAVGGAISAAAGKPPKLGRVGAKARKAVGRAVGTVKADPGEGPRNLRGRVSKKGERLTDDQVLERAFNKGIIGGRAVNRKRGGGR